MKRKTKLLRLVMLCMLMLFSASEMWATDLTVNVKCEPTGVAKVYAKFESEAEYTENQRGGTTVGDSGNFNLKYDNLQEGYTFLGWSKGAPSTNASDMVSTDQVATVTVLSSEPTVTYYANFASGSNFTITKDADAEAHGDIQFNVGEGESLQENVTTAKEGDKVTVIITPSTGWVVNQPSGQWYAAVAAARSQRTASVDLLDKVTLTPVEGQTNQWTFTMARANVEISSTYKKLLTNTDITIDDITAPTYTGQALTPDVTVKDGSTVLTKDVDYTVTYSNNTNAALATAAQNAPTVTITAVSTSEKYAGETTKTFTILPKALEDGFIANIASLVYTGVAQTPEPAVTYNNMTLVKGTDFTYSYTNNVNVAAATAENAPTVTVTGKGNYTGTAQKKFDITKKALTVTADNKSVTFGDDAPQYTVSYDGFVNNETNAVLGGTLAFACSYVKNQTGAGNYDITPSGLTSSNYDITFTKGTLTVYKKHLDHPDITISNILPVTYNAQPHTPSFTVKDGSKVLVLGTDYTVTYSDNVMACDKDAVENAPTVTIKAVEGHNFYVGENSKTFTIRKKTLEDGFMSKVADLTYNGKAQEPAPTLTYDGITLVEGKDYVFSYINNKDVASTTDAKAPVVTASAVKNSNFTGAATQKFNIKKAPLTVKAADVNIIHGSEVPEYEVSYEGFVAQETADVLEGTLAVACDYTKESAVGSTYDITPSGLTAKNYDITFVDGTLTVVVDQNAPYKETLQTAIAIASNINPEALADAIAAAQAAMTAEDATAESLTQANQTLETAIKAYLGEILPGLGAIVEGLNDETLNAAYADAEAALAKEDVTLQELVAAMQQIIAAAQDVAPEHLQNLKEYAVKYGAEDAATLIDAALEAIESGNVSQIIATMTAVKEAATPLAEQVLGTMINYVQAFGLTEQAAQAQAALESGNYITMITTAKELFSHLIAAAKEYLPKLGAIAEGLNDETLNSAYAAAQALLAKESITPEELGTAMQQIIAAAKAVAPEHLQNLKEYAVKYGADDAATLIDAALEAIESGNVSQIIATMTAVKEAATPLATAILTQMIEKAQSYTGFEEDITEAQAALESGNYITMITAAKALYAKLQAVVTGVGSMKAAFEKDVWYDLNGHKLNGKPTKKGVYFINGKKVVMK